MPMGVEILRKKQEINLVLMLAIFLLVSTVYVNFAFGTYTKSNARTIAAFGEDAEIFASSIAARTNLPMVTRIDDRCMIAVISDIKDVEVSAVSRALQNKAVIVAVNLPAGNELISVPTLDKKDVKIEYTIDLEQNKVTSERVVGETITKLYPAYWVGVIQYEGILKMDSYALMIDSPQERVELLSTIAAKVVDTSIATMNSVQSITVLSEFPAPTDDWKKRAERSYTWNLGSGNQLYTRYEMFSLRCWDEVTQKEYWRTDAYIDHYLPTYVQNTGHCGPWINMRQMIVAASAGTNIYDYAPHTTAQDTGASVNIGFSVTPKGGPSIGIGYSWSWTNPGVRYDVGADYVNSKITWNETFRGPDYLWYPWYSGPTEAAHNSYNAKTTVIMRTSLGSGLYISSLKSKWEKYDDTLTFLIIVLKVDRVITTYTYPFSVGQLESIFKCIIKIQSSPTTDFYSRSHGLAVDVDLPELWWTLQGYQFMVTGTAFTYTKTVYILPGSHFVEYAASGYVPNYAWHAKIYINNVFIVEGDVGRNSANHLRASFTTWWVT